MLPSSSRNVLEKECSSFSIIAKDRTLDLEVVSPRAVGYDAEVEIRHRDAWVGALSHAVFGGGMFGESPSRP